MKIPKIIHYCWFGGKDLSATTKKCIRSWETHCPEFEIKCWDESAMEGCENLYFREALSRRKWAFASDYVRLKALKEYGGIYLDTDVELLKSPLEYMDNDVFIGRQNEKTLATAVIGSIPHHPFVELLMEEY